MNAEQIAKLRDLAEKATPGPWVVCQTVIHGKDYGGHWVEGVELDPEDPAHPERLVQISGSGGARSWTARIFDRQIHDDNEANALFIAAANPVTILALLDALAAANARVAEVEGERDQWHTLASDTHTELQAIGEEYGFLGGEPRVDGVRRVLSEQRTRADTAEARLAEARAEIAKLRAEVQRWDREYLSDAEVGGIVRHHPHFRAAALSPPQQAGTEVTP